LSDELVDILIFERGDELVERVVVGFNAYRTQDLPQSISIA